MFVYNIIYRKIIQFLIPLDWNPPWRSLKFAPILKIDEKNQRNGHPKRGGLSLEYDQIRLDNKIRNYFDSLLRNKCVFII